MFTQELRTIPILTDVSSDELFDQIVAEDWDNDHDSTILAVTRALLLPRIEDTDKKYTYAEMPRIDFDYLNKPNSLTIFNDLYYDSLLEKESQWTGWAELKDIEQYLKRYCEKDVKVFINEENSAALVFCADLDNKTRHVLAAMIPRLFPDVFRNNLIDKLEQEMLHSLVLYYPGKFQEKIAEVAGRLSVTRKMNAIKVRQFTKMYYNSRLDFVKRDWQNAVQRLETALADYADAVRSRDEALMRYEGARTMVDSAVEDSELFDFLMSHKNINIVQCANNHLIIVIENYIDVFDADGFEAFGDRFYNQFNLGNMKIFNNDMDDFKLMMNALFSSDPKLHIRTCGYYDLRIGGAVTTTARYKYTCVDRIPNPHLQYHACLGQYAPLIQKKLADGDIMGAILQCNGSVMSVNVHEAGPTFIPFVEEVFTSTGKVLETFDKVQMTPKEALEWLKAQEE